MSDKTCLDLMVGLGNKYPKQLLNSAVHKVLYTVLRFDRQVVNVDYDNRVQDEYLTQKYDLRSRYLFSKGDPRRCVVRVTRCHLQD
jgi:hypothetical protein